MRMPLRTYVCAPPGQKKLQKNNRIFPRRYKSPTLMWDGSGAIADDTLRDIQDGLSGLKKSRPKQNSRVTGRSE